MTFADSNGFRTLTNWLSDLPRDFAVQWAAAGCSPADDIPVVFDRFTDPDSTDFTTGLLVYVAGENFDPVFPEDLGMLGVDTDEWTVTQVGDAIRGWVIENTGRADLTFVFNPTFPAAAALHTWAAQYDGHGHTFLADAST